MMLRSKKGQMDINRSVLGMWLWATVAVFSLVVFYMVAANPITRVYTELNETLPDEASVQSVTDKVFFMWRFWPLMLIGAIVIIALMGSIRRDTRSDDVF